MRAGWRSWIGWSVGLIAAALVQGGCASADYNADNGDIAARPVEHFRATLPLTVAVRRFEDRSAERLPKGAIDAWTRSFVTVLGASEVFKDVFVPSRKKPAVADLNVSGVIHRADLHRNYVWLTTWGIFAVGTLGYGTVIGPLLGLPWATDSVDFDLEVRVTTAAGTPVSVYRSRFADTLYLTAYTGDEGQTGYCQDARVPLQAIMERSVGQLIDDYDRYRPLAERKDVR